MKYLIYIVSVGIGIIIFGVQCELNISRVFFSRDIKLALLTFILDLNCMPSLSYREMRLRCICVASAVSLLIKDSSNKSNDW